MMMMMMVESEGDRKLGGNKVRERGGGGERERKGVPVAERKEKVKEKEMRVREGGVERPDEQRDRWRYIE